MRKHTWARLQLFTAIASALAVGACRAPSENEASPSIAANAESPTPPLPIADRPIDRAGLLAAVARVASATAMALDDLEQQQGLDGKTFELRIRFGCPGAATEPTEATPFTIRYDEEKRTLRVRAAPDLTLSDPPIAAVAGPSVEAVEGFWLYRPWLLADGCPAVPLPRTTSSATVSNATETETAAEAETEQVSRTRSPSRPQPRVGVAQFYTDTDPRTERRDERAYETTKVLGAGELPSAQGYNLVLSGRLRRPPQGKVITCRVISPDTPPECVVSVSIDRVRIERPNGGMEIAEWSR